MILMGTATDWYPSVDDLPYLSDAAHKEVWPAFTIWPHMYRPADIGTVDEMFMSALGDILT